MQRLSDIFHRDLHAIMETFRDFTRQTVLQCGAVKKTVWASMQADGKELPADVSPVNAFALELYFIETDCAAFNNSLLTNAIIYVDGVAFRIVDSATVYDLRVLSLERKSRR